MIKKYIAYLWKKTYKLVLIAFLVFFLLYPVVMLVQGEPYLVHFSYGYETETHEWITVDTNYTYIYSQDTLLYMLTILAMASSYLIPLMVQATFQNKKRCDNLLSLPLKKQTQILLTSAYGFVVFLIVWWLTALIGLGTSFIVNLRYNVPYFFLYLLCMSILSLAVFGITTLFASLMNNVLDSLLMVLISICLPVAFNLTMSFDISQTDTLLYTVPIYAADRITCFFQQEVAYCSEGLREFCQSLEKYNYYFNYSFGAREITAISVFTGLGLLSYATSYLLWRKMRAEEMQTPSQKWYGYPLAFSALMVFPFYGIKLLKDFSGNDLLLTAIFAVAYFVGMFIFQRKIKFNKTNLIGFAVTFITANLLTILI